MPISALVDGGDGCLYGTSFNGGNGFAGGGGGLGTVFKLTYGGAISVLARFNGEDGRNPVGGLTLGRDRAFYGTTALGGVSNFGTVFRISRSGELSTLASFSGTNGAMPHGGLAMGPDGSFYGITAYRGKMGSSYGSIFRVTTNGVLTTLVALDGVMARNPWGEMTLTSKGEWWGVMFDLMKRSGDGNGGLIFKLVD